MAFRCMTSMNTLAACPGSEKVTLYTYLNVREDALDLFGFATKGGALLLPAADGISGVGPKVGLAILSQLTPEEVALAAAAGDAKRFTKASGVGAEAGSAHCAGAEGQGEGPLRRRPVAGMPEPGGPSASGNASQAVGPWWPWGIRPARPPPLWAGWTAPCPGGIDPPGAEELCSGK